MAALLRVFAAASPILAGYVVASLVGASFHPFERWQWWLAVLGSAVVAGWLTMLAAVRLRLLAMLCELSLVFPGRAPERWEVVRLAKNPIRLRRNSGRASIGRDLDVVTAATTVLSMVLALPRHDRQSSGYPHRVVAYADLIARQLRIGDADRDRLHWAALSHGLGKLLLDRDLLAKPGELTTKEQETWETYPGKGMRLIGPMAAWLGASALAIESHAENWDGSGFPDHKSGDQIPVAARIVAVAASLDLLTTGTGAMDHRTARRQIASASNTDFDPIVVRAFLQIPTGRLRAAAGPFSRLPFSRATAARMVAVLGRPGPVLALSAAFLVTTGAGLAGALLPVPDLTTIDASALLDLIVQEDPTSTTTAPRATTSAPDETTTTVAESTTSPPAVTTTTRGPRRPTTTTAPTTTSTSLSTTTTTQGTSTTSTSSSTTTTTEPPSTTTTTEPPTTTTTEPPTTTTTEPPTTTTTEPPTTTTTEPPTTTTTT